MYIFDLNTRYPIIKVFLDKKLKSPTQPFFRNTLLTWITLILLVAFTPSSSSFAQVVSINVKNESITKVLTQIKKQTGYDFVISSKNTAQTVKASLKVQNIELTELLKELCDSTGLTFKIKDRTIYISELNALKPSSNTATSKSTERDSIPKGQVLNEKGESLPGASLRIFDNKEDIIHSQIVTNEDGNFEIPSKYKGNRLVISYMGYVPQSISIEESIGEIHLQYIPVDVQEVLIEGKKPLIKRSIDKLTLNIEGTIYEKGENGLKLLNAIPGINVIGDNIEFRGAQKITVYIDNRKLNLPQHIINTYLESIPSETILSYELKSVPGAENDAQNAGSIINIVMKSAYKFGLTSNANTGYWYNGEHNFNLGSFLNYHKRKTTFHGRAYYRNSPAFYEDYINQAFLSQDLYLEQDEKYLEKHHSYTFTLGLDHKLRENQVIGFNYNIFTNPGDFSNSTTSNSTFRNQSNMFIDSTSMGVNTNNYRYINQMANAFYRKKIDTIGSVLDLGYSFVGYSYSNPSGLETVFYDSSGTEKVTRDSIFTYNDGSSNAHIYNVDLERKFNKNWSMAAGSKFTSSKTNYIMEYRDGLDANAPLIPMRTDAFSYKEDIFALYSSIHYSINKWEAKLGFRTEHTDYKGFSRFTDQKIGKSKWHYFPSVFVKRDISDIQSLTFSYGRNISRPGFRQLNPFTYYTNINNIQEGNPFLVSYYSNNTELEYLLKNKYSFTIGYQNTLDAIASKFSSINDVTISREENIADFNTIFFSTYIPVKINSWWDINFNGNLKNTTVDVRTSPEINKSKFSQHINVMNRFSLPNKLIIEVSGMYARNRFFDYYDAKDIGKMDIAIRKSFLKDKLSTRFEIQDPLHLYKLGQTVVTDSFSRNVNRNRLDFARYVGLWLTYNISSGKKDTSRENIDAGGNEVRNRL